MRKSRKTEFRVYVDHTALPEMFGIECSNGMRIRRLSTDFQEVDRLVCVCNRERLSPLHLQDVAEDFRRS